MTAAEVDAVDRRTVLASERGFLRRLISRPMAWVCLFYLFALVIIAVGSPLLLPNVSSEHAGDLLAVRQAPSGEHLLGTDVLGRDVASRLLAGTGVTLLGVAQTVVVALALGVPLGLLAGYVGKIADRAISAYVDLVIAIPSIIMTLVVLAVFPQSMTAAMVTLGVICTPSVIRVVRAATLPVREELYVAAARVSGLSGPYIVTRHVLPRVVGPVIVQASMIASIALIVQTGLSFLGLIVAPPAPSWGAMIAEGVDALRLSPWLIWPPGLATAATIVVFGLLGDAARDANAEKWSGTSPNRRRRTHKRQQLSRTAQHQESHAESADSTDGESLIDVEGLSVVLDGDQGSTTTLVSDVSFDVKPGEVVGLVGESGCGKTMTAVALLGLLPAAVQISSGRVRFKGRDLTQASERALGRVRGTEIGFISQEPMVSLNPAFRVGWQIAEAVRVHRGDSRRTARAEAIRLLGDVRLPDPESIARKYPHELSGGMAQRVAIARALAGEPELLIADEPTTALDVTVQAGILSLLRELCVARGMAVLIVTHDWGVVADICHRAVVMYAGQVVERAAVRPLFAQPMHPYTAALMLSDPHHSTAGERLRSIGGTVPSPGSWPAGCHFRDRCRFARRECTEQPVPVLHPSNDRETRCLYYNDLLAKQ